MPVRISRRYISRDDIIMYKISSNFGRPVKKNKNKKNTSTSQQLHTVRFKWVEIENMTIDDLDIYLTKSFKINR